MFPSPFIITDLFQKQQALNQLDTELKQQENPGVVSCHMTHACPSQTSQSLCLFPETALVLKEQQGLCVPVLGCPLLNTHSLQQQTFFQNPSGNNQGCARCFGPASPLLHITPKG